MGDVFLDVMEKAKNRAQFKRNVEKGLAENDPLIMKAIIERISPVQTGASVESVSDRIRNGGIFSKSDTGKDKRVEEEVRRDSGTDAPMVDSEG